MTLFLNTILSILAISLGCGLVAFITMHFSLVAWRKSADQHWTSRARLLWTARLSRIWIVICCVFIGVFFAAEIAHVDVANLTVLMIVCAVLLGLYPSNREIEPRFTFPVWFRHVVWSLVFNFGLMSIGIWLASTMPKVMTAEAWIRTSIGLAGAIVIISGIYLPALARLLPNKPELKPMYQRLRSIADTATKNTGIVPRNIWLADSPIANAIAFPIINSVTFTTRTMESLDDEECLSVMYHEYAHLREPWAVRLMRILPMLSFYIFIFLCPMHHAFEAFGILLLALLFFGIIQSTNAVMRRMEHRADDHSIAMSDHSAVYARALEKIHEASQIPAIMASKKMIHPNLYDRMLQAGLTPDYEPPLPPAGISVAAMLLIILSIITFIFLIIV